MKEEVLILYRVVRKASLMGECLNRNLDEVRELGLWKSGRKACQAKGRVSTKVLRWDHARPEM